MTADLIALDAALDAETAALKRRKEVFSAIVARRFEEQARAQLTASGKDTGTATLVSNGITIKAEFKKKVEWDQAKLIAAANAMKPEDARHYLKVEMKVD